MSLVLLAGNPALEFYTKPSSIVLDGDNSKIYLPFTLPSHTCHSSL